MDAHLDDALARLSVCIDGCSPWRPGEFNVLQSSQHTIFLYYLANSIWKGSGDTAAPTRLFLMNKAFNGIDLFYEIAMPPVFYIGHSVGIVLAKATYGNHLVLYQGATVGRHKDQIPVIGDRVVLYRQRGGRRVGHRRRRGDLPGAGDRKDRAHRMIAFAGEGGELVRPADDLLAEYFRL